MNILWQHPNPSEVNVFARAQKQFTSEWIPVSHLGRLRYESIESVMAKWDWDKLCFHLGQGAPTCVQFAKANL